jgi:hypothetical protein
MQKSGKTFLNERIDIEEHQFSDCTFQNCIIEFKGEGEPHLDGCFFPECGLYLKGRALYVVAMLSALRGTSPSMEKAVDQLLDKIRSGEAAKLMPDSRQ